MGAVHNFSDISAESTSAVATAQSPAVALPVISREAFAAAAGITSATVFSMCDRGYLPTVHFGRRVFINLEVLRSRCAAKEFS